MAVTTDIFRSWRAPRAVMRDHLARGRREDQAIAFLMGGCFVVFLSRLPALQRETLLGTGDFTRDAAYSFFGLLMVMPLLFYGLAFAGRVVARAVGLRLADWQARTALFWAWLAASPAALLYGLLAGLNGTGEAGTQAVGAIWLLAFGVIWVQGVRESAARGATA